MAHLMDELLAEEVIIPDIREVESDALGTDGVGGGRPDSLLSPCCFMRVMVPITGSFRAIPHDGRRKGVDGTATNCSAHPYIYQGFFHVQLRIFLVIDHNLVDVLKPNLTAKSNHRKYHTITP